MPTIASQTELEQAIVDFARALERGIRIEAIILYGSYTGGEPHEWSDIDLAVISPDFEAVSMSERQSMLAHLAWRDTDVRIEPIGYPSSEYHNPGRHSFLREVIRTGRVVYEAPRE